MKLTLYIDGREAALSAGSDEALILWTYTRDDAEAPAAVKNSYTKTITLPACDANDRIFSHAGTLDRVTASGMFDALRRTPFIIYADDGRVLDRGYLKLDRVSRRGEVVLSYDVTLYGGLGGFLYDLTYNADGTKRTLADIRWVSTSQRPTTQDLITLKGNQSAEVPSLSAGWTALINGSYESNLFGIVNYVPAQNGIPEGDFDAGLAYVKQQSDSPSGGGGYNLGGVSTRVVKDNVTYTGELAGGLGVILDLGGKFTEWETQCFVPELQREAWNVARFILSLAVASYAGDFGGWRLIIDEQDGGFFDEQLMNPYFWDTWVTLEPGDLSQRHDIYSHLLGTKTPADYLLGFAKMFGLVFLVNEVEQTIELITREDYYARGYAKGIIDLSDRVDTHGEPAEVKPFLATARMYDFAAPTAGAFAGAYEARYGRTYGDFLLDSGFTFDAGTIDVMKDSPFRGAADVKESSPWYVTLPDPDDLAGLRSYVKFVLYGSPSYKLVAPGTNKTLKVDVPPVKGTISYTIPALPQFHDENNRRIKAPDVMLFLNGHIDLPHNGSPFTNSWHIGTYTQGGKRIWNLSLMDSVTPVTQIPIFRRSIPVGQEYAYLDYGQPKEVASGIVPGQQDAFVYPDFWSSYMSDRFDRDTMVLDIRVNLAGLPAGPELLSRFFYYRGSLWSLNKITDFNPARPGLTRCQFIRVKDRLNYTSRQYIPGA